MSAYEIVMLLIGILGIASTRVSSDRVSPRLASILSGKAIWIVSLLVVVLALTSVILRTSGALDESFVVEGKVRCDGGGLLGNGQKRSTTVRYTSPAGFQIVDYTTEERRRQYGSTGNIATELDEKGRLRTVSVVISCDAPNKIGGKGGWNDTALVGTIRPNWLSL